jgi:hypothetical protein
VDPNRTVERSRGQQGPWIGASRLASWRGGRHAVSWPIIRFAKSEVVEIPGAELAGQRQKSCATQKSSSMSRRVDRRNAPNMLSSAFVQGMPRQVCASILVRRSAWPRFPPAFFHAIAFLYLIYVVVAFV